MADVIGVAPPILGQHHMKRNETYTSEHRMLLKVKFVNSVKSTYQTQVAEVH